MFTNEQLIESVKKQIANSSYSNLNISDIEVTQKGSGFVWFSCVLFGKYERKFTCLLTATGKVKAKSIRFDDNLNEF